MTDLPANEQSPGRSPVGRRKFLGYVLGGATVIAAADIGLLAPEAQAKIPSGTQIADQYDLNDLLTDATRPTANLITVEVNEDGTASFAIPRAEVGQGITTAAAMIIAEELELPLEKVDVTLAPARPELLWNQITGGSNTIYAMYTPIRVAAAIAKQALLEAGVIVLGGTVDQLKAREGLVIAPDGSTATYGELTKIGASPTTEVKEAALKDESSFAVVGRPTLRKDALAAVTGQKVYTTDLDVEGALPTMVCRAPTLNGTPVAVRNASQIESMPGVTHVAQVPTGVAVRAATFGQCIDAIRALDVEWADGPVAGMSDQDVLAELKSAELPMPSLPSTLVSKSIAADFTFYFRSNSAMDTNSAVADVRENGAEIWGSFKNPIICGQDIAAALGVPQGNVKVHVVEGGGSFGRRLFSDAALEAAHASKAMGVPVKLMWHRADDSRVGRAHPMATSRVRTSYALGQVLAFQQAHTSIETDFRHGVGEAMSGMAADLPLGLGNLGVAEAIFHTTAVIPYDFGVLLQTLNETDSRFNTSSMRNVYSPDVRTANELVVDQLAKAMRQDPLDFRIKFTRNPRLKRLLQEVKSRADWGKAMPSGMAQGVGVHQEYKGVTACVVEIDCRPQTVNRNVWHAITGPRVTKATIVIDPGMVINPTGVEAQMQGCINDAIAMTLTSSLHLRDGHFLEASWDNYAYTRQWNTPPEVDVVISPTEGHHPGGAGEAGVAATCAAIACAYTRATGRMPTEFPIAHNQPLHFEPKPFTPPVPQSPTNGLDWTY